MINIKAIIIWMRMIDWLIFFQDYDIFFAPGLESSVCRRMASVHNADVGQKLITVDSDSTGMGIQVSKQIINSIRCQHCGTFLSGRRTIHY